MKLNNLGWVVAAGMAGLMIAGGFQGSSQKTGVVDIAQLFQSGDVTRRSQDELRNFAQTRSDILMFLRTYKSLPTTKAERFKELSLKVQPTAAEKAELDKIRSDAIAEDKVYKALQTKSSPTPEEVKQLEEMGKNTQALSTLERTMAQQFDAEVNQKRDGMRDDVLVKIRASVQEVAKKQGYSIVFVKDVVPYGANDLTPEALKVLNTKK